MSADPSPYAAATAGAPPEDAAGWPVAADISMQRPAPAPPGLWAADAYEAAVHALAARADLLRIAEWITPGSRVLDLGCADGALLVYLGQTRQVRGAGVELDDGQVIAAVRRGVRVIQQNLEEGLALFDDGQFDTVVLSQTLQSMHHTEHILREMARVAHYGIVSFPNFGYWTHGLSILSGRMPVSDQMPYQWYDTPNIHLCTLRDFQALAGKLGLRITHLAAFRGAREIRYLRGWRSTLAVYRFESPRGRRS